MIGRVEISAGLWATLNDDLAWEGDDLHPDTVKALNTVFGTGTYSPADGARGSDQLREAARVFGLGVEYAEPPPIEEGGIY